MTERERILRLIRRARTALEAVRLSKGAARGALVGGGAGLAALLAMKVVPAWPVVALIPWALVGSGAVLGLLVSGARAAITPEAAGLFLDRRLHTQERFVTVLTRPAGSFTDRVAAELTSARKLPRLPFPREAALVPAALFFVFAAGLLPEAGAQAVPRTTIVSVESGGIGTGAFAPAAEIDPEVLERFEKGETLDEETQQALREALERRAHRPEERAAAREAFQRALQGDTEAAKALAAKVRDKRRRETGGVTQADAYPGEAKFLREYRRARAEEER